MRRWRSPTTPSTGCPGEVRGRHRPRAGDRAADADGQCHHKRQESLRYRQPVRWHRAVRSVTATATSATANTCTPKPSAYPNERDRSCGSPGPWSPAAVRASAVVWRTPRRRRSRNPGQRSAPNALKRWSMRSPVVRRRERFRSTSPTTPAATAAISAAGPVDVLVNNAGNAGPRVREPGGFADTEPGNWEAFLREPATASCTAPVRCCRDGCQPVGPHSDDRVRRRPYGDRRCGHGAAKAGAAGLTRSVALENGRYNITANNISLGTMRTPPDRALWAEHADSPGQRPSLANRHSPPGIT